MPYFHAFEINANARVDAWEELRYNNDNDYEREAALIVRTPDGRFFTTGFRPYTTKVRDNFAIVSDRWTPIDPIEVNQPLPAAAPVLVGRRGANWIGRYSPTPALIQAAKA